LLRSLQAALPDAYHKLNKLGKMDGKTMIKSGDWEIGMNKRPTDKYPVVMHTLYLKKH
jgi:hypothetical protein